MQQLPIFQRVVSSQPGKSIVLLDALNDIQFERNIRVVDFLVQSPVFEHVFCVFGRILFSKYTSMI